MSEKTKKTISLLIVICFCMISVMKIQFRFRLMCNMSTFFLHVHFTQVWKQEFNPSEALLVIRKLKLWYIREETVICLYSPITFHQHTLFWLCYLINDKIKFAFPHFLWVRGNRAQVLNTILLIKFTERES